MNPAPTALRRARIGMFGAFATSGFVMGAWAAALPSVDARLELGPARIGTTLLVIEAVALATMVLAGKIADRHTTRTLLRWTGPASQLLLIAPALAPDYTVLLICGALYGVGVGFTEVGLNAHSVELERYYKRPIVSSFHGFWSLGGAAAGALTSLGLTLGLGSQSMLVAAAALAAAAFAWYTLPLLPPPGQDTGGSSGSPRRTAAIAAGVLAAVAAVTLAGHLIEAGAIGWANVHATRVLDADEALAPLSYTVFACAMTVFRLLGDPIRGRLGPARTLLTAGGVAFTGYTLVLLSGLTGGLPLAWAGWILAGSGIAVIVPVMFSAVGAAGGTPSNIALVSMSGSAGLLIGPAAIGYIAAATSLTVGLLVPAVLALFVAAVGPLTMRRLLRPATSATPEPPRETLVR